MLKKNSIKILLLTTLLTNLAYAKQTLCYKEDLSTISSIETVFLDGGECKGTKTVKDMKNDSWIIDDIKINTKDNKYNFTYVFKKREKNIVSEIDIEKKINKFFKKEKVLNKDEKISLGEVLYKKDCLSCHGIKGDKESRNSKDISNIREFDYYQIMSDYSVSDIKSPTAYIMNPIAKFLKDDEIENLYLYIQTLKK